mmetsp:Transcript_30681/g.94791  ORF Transcript_30681/g.94791 Transcript_30681/m.94791 type:complete len:251 (-) Transcript_30681:270-1022(-)
MHVRNRALVPVADERGGVREWCRDLELLARLHQESMKQVVQRKPRGRERREKSVRVGLGGLARDEEVAAPLWRAATLDVVDAQLRVGRGDVVLRTRHGLRRGGRERLWAVGWGGHAGHRGQGAGAHVWIRVESDRSAAQPARGRRVDRHFRGRRAHGRGSGRRRGRWLLSTVDARAAVRRARQGWCCGRPWGWFARLLHRFGRRRRRRRCCSCGRRRCRFCDFRRRSRTRQYQIRLDADRRRQGLRRHHR